jgi:hypothetical protein
MRTLRRTAVALGFIGAMAIGTTVPVMAQGIYFNAPGVHIDVGRPYHRHYYDYYGGGVGWRTGNGCPPDWTIQGGVCKPYRHGPWDIYGGRQSDYGY